MKEEAVPGEQRGVRAQHGRRGARVQGVRAQARVLIGKGRKVRKAQARRGLTRRGADRCVHLISWCLLLDQRGS